jgi:acetyl-CoA acetyltransferase
VSTPELETRRRREIASYRGKAAAVGLAEVAPAKAFPGETTLSLATKIALDAIEDSGIPLSEVDGVCIHGLGDVMFAPSLIAESLGIRPTFAEHVDLGGATAGGMIWRAAAAVATGMCETVVCITATVPVTPPPPPPGVKASRAMRGMGGGPHTQFDIPYGGVGVNWAYAMIARRYMHEYGVTEEQFARVSAYQRDNAQANPNAYFHGTPITVEDVLASPYVTEPLRVLNIVMPMGGAAAVVITSREAAEGLPNRPAYLHGAGESATHWSISNAPSLTTTAIKPAADRAFAMAGIERAQVGLASVYDCYSHVVLLCLEDAGFCGKGEGGRFVEEHDFRWHGDFPVNTHGGQLSAGQSGIAGGMSHVTEAIRQLQGRADGRQIEGLEYAYVNTNGGMMSEEVSLILGVEG